MDPSKDSQAIASNVLTVVIHLVSASILSFCLARRSFFRITPKRIHPVIQRSQIASSRGLDMPGVDERRPSARTFDTIRKPMGWAHRFWRDTSLSNYTFQTTPSRFTTFLTLVTSLLFVISSSIVVTGVGLNSNPIASIDQGLNGGDPKPTTSCGVVLNLCIFFYGITKICVFVVLIERVYIVSCAGSSPPRMSTRTYKIGILGIIIYIGIIILVVFARITEVETITYPVSNSSPTEPTIYLITEVCTVGFQLYGSIPVIVYETVLTVVLTSMFLLPILNSQGRGHEIRLLPCPITKKFFSPATQPKPASIHLPELTPQRSDPHNTIPSVHRPITPSTTHTHDDDGDDPQFNFLDPDQSIDVPSSWGLELEHQGLQSKELNQLAKRCLFGSLAGLIVSFANICVLASRNGREEGMECMRWCVADVVVNAVAIYAVIQGKEDWWWLRDREGVRPDVSLPPGIWGVTDHGTAAGAAAGMQGASTRGRSVGVGVMEEASVVPTEKSARSIGFLDEYSLGNGQKPPPSGRRSRLDDLLSPFSPPSSLPHPGKVSPLDLHFDRQMARKTKCVSLQPDPRRSSSIKMRFSSSFDSLGRHAGKGKGKEKEEWSSGAVSGESVATTQGHSALATPLPSVNPHQPPLPATNPTNLPAS